MCLAAETAANKGRNDAHALRRHPNRLRDLALRAKRVLRRSPDGCLVSLDLRQRGMGLHGRVSDIAIEISPLEGLAGQLAARRKVSAFGDRPTLRIRFEEMFKDRLVVHT